MKARSKPRSKQSLQKRGKIGRNAEAGTCVNAGVCCPGRSQNKTL